MMTDIVFHVDEMMCVHAYHDYHDTAIEYINTLTANINKTIKQLLNIIHKDTQVALYKGTEEVLHQDRNAEWLQILTKDSQELMEMLY
ncbi:unnamed protein product [Rhizophagus irregularis]|nr:unnamed protein product [Rhizophagus irregularis]CAB4441246.1 unnamed protein product [Rhizophagus irregularis]